jgi:hypothetical protein
MVSEYGLSALRRDIIKFWRHGSTWLLLLLKSSYGLKPAHDSEIDWYVIQQEGEVTVIVKPRQEA